MRRKLEDKAFVRRFARDARQFLERKSKQIRLACAADFPRFSDAALSRRFQSVSAMADEYYTRMWLVFLINEPLADAVFGALKARAPHYADELLLAFSSPLTPNDAICERQGLLRIAMEKDPRRQSLLLEKHARRFAHIPVFDFNHAPYELGHFKKELARIRNPLDELTKLNHLFAQRRRDFPWLLSKLRLPKTGLELAQIRMLSDLAHLRDYRDTLRQKMNLAMREIYDEIARRAHMSIADVSLLTNDEIGILLGQVEQRHSLKELARQRRHGFQLDETAGKVAVTMPKPKSNITTKMRGTFAQLQGIAASPGTASGTARIVLTNLDLPKIRDGDVMVATMTRQDFVPYIRRCAALVTDEGGVTCHAAIIARELGIPCVVGTKRATQLIQEGRKIVVEGRRGTVSNNSAQKSA